MVDKMMKKKVGAVMVVGGGITGMQSALDLANSGFKVYLVEKTTSIGGRMSQLDKTFPTNDCSMCMISPKLIEVAKHRNIELITNAEVEALEGEEGNFKVKVLKRPRYVDIQKCSGCGDCITACPVELNNEFEQDLNKRKAIYKRYPQAIPGSMAITKAARPPCKLTCPAKVDVQGYVALISKGKNSEALALIKERLPLPGILGRICTHPCESECNRKSFDEPISICALKRFAADQVKDAASPLRAKIKNDKVAVIGSGPAGLTAAYFLARDGYPVTIFEALPVVGGMLSVGIPEYRLPRKIIEEEVEGIKRLGVEIKTSTPIGKDLTIDNLFQQGYRAIFLATGAHQSQKLGIPREDEEGVIHGVNFLRNLNLDRGIKAGEKIAVIGGGNVAIDAARSALRLGSREVSILYRRTKSEMPASAEEIEAAEAEGVKIRYLTAPTEVLTQNGKVKGIRCLRMELGEPDASGRRRPVPVKGSEFDIDVDMVIPAIGQVPDLSFLTKDSQLEIDKRGALIVDPVTLATSRKGIFAGGDLRSGPATAVEAVAQGHEAAISIERYFLGLDLKKDREKAKEEAAPIPEGQHPRVKRVTMRTIPLEKRASSFQEVNLGYTEEEAKKEADRCLNCGLCSECLQCVAVCQAKAVDHTQKAEHLNINVGSVVLAPGFDPFDAKIKGEYGYGRMPNVVTSLEFERILSASGPYQGQVKRPSDGRHPVKIAWIQCVGSRDKSCGRDYCSSVCCMYATKEAIIAREHDSHIQPTIFYNDIRAFGKGFERYYESAKEKFGVRYVNSIPSMVKELQKSHNLLLDYTDDTGKKVQEEFDMVVLSVGLVPAAGTKELAEKVGIKLDQFGFCATDEMRPNVTSRPGVYVAGAFTAPIDIPESVMSASGAACLAGQDIQESRGTLVTEKVYPDEKDIAGEEPRVGVFICRCGSNIARVVDVPAVVEYARTIPHVIHAEENLYTCSTDTQEKVIKAIKEKNLNRVVVASCSPRTHEPLFQDTIREGGLNGYLFEMANIRDQCSWVHATHMPQSTTKAKDLVRMAVARAITLLPLHQQKADVKRRALIIGGGLAGMTAARGIAAQGFEAVLVEKEKELGGNLREIYFTEQDVNPQALLVDLIKQVEANPKIKVFKGAKVKKMSGFLGNYVTEISTDKGSVENIEHGVVIIATGGAEYKPTEYLYGQSSQIITQLELEKKLADKALDLTSLKSVVMIQCVGSREADHLYCSRVCCSQAINNAIKLKEAAPEMAVYILYRDIRSYGLHELQYRKAREMGITFIHFDAAKKPEAALENGNLKIKVTDKALNREIILNPDLLVLSAAIRPQPDAEEFAANLKLPLTQDKFVMEAHMKLRPLDLVNEGMYLCGLAHAPKTISESIAQAQGTVSRAVTVLSQPYLMVGGVVSVVDPEKCAACLTCVRSCPYDVPRINEEGVAYIEPAACQGCGICASVCPRKAITLQHYSDEQIIAKVDALKEPVGERSK